MSWTTERIETCRRLYIEDGFTAAETARLLGDCSRNAVLGIAHRLGWPRKAEVGDINREIGKWLRRREPRPPREERSPAQLPQLAEATQARPWLSRRRGECAFPIGEPETPALQLSCCAPVAEGERYCARHLKILRLPPPCTTRELETSLERYFA